MAAALTQGLNNMFIDENYLIVAAIDFGTTFSAYAFSFASSPNEIRMNKNWGAGGGFESYKAPTCVLTKPNGDFDSFGYDAENNFSQLDQDEVDPEGGYNLYRNFKMCLHKQGAKITSKVTSTSGCVRLAVDIFAMALRYLKNHMLEAIQKSVTKAPDDSMIRWVITVPAIWTDESKRFMREAAYQARLINEVNSKKLMIALEPEAASIFCRNLEINEFVTADDKKEDVSFKTGNKVLVIDAGGGTVDITAHEMMFNSEVKELVQPSGGPWGGTKVDLNFSTLIGKVLGADFINKFKREHANEWLMLMLSFERAKRSAHPSDKSTKGIIKIPLSWALGTAFKDFGGKGIDEAIKLKANLGVSFNNGSLVINKLTTVELFKPVVDSTVSHVKELLKGTRLRKVDYILLVGGFGECKFLQQACIDSFSDKAKVLIPASAQLAIIKGAVLFGHKPNQISSRIARLTYGCSGDGEFNEQVHDVSHSYLNEDGEIRCENCFSVFVHCGDSVQVASPYMFSFVRPSKGATSVVFDIYSTEKHDPIYVDESGVNKVSSVILKSSSGPLSLKLDVRVIFGGTELLVEAQERDKGEEFPVKTIVAFDSQ